MMVAPPLHADNIGDITELRGNGAVLRGDTFTAEVGFDIQQMDDVRTGNGRLAISFLDDVFTENWV